MKKQISMELFLILEKSNLSDFTGMISNFKKKKASFLLYKGGLTKAIFNKFLFPFFFFFFFYRNNNIFREKILKCGFLNTLNFCRKKSNLVSKIASKKKSFQMMTQNILKVIIFKEDKKIKKNNISD